MKNSLLAHSASANTRWTGRQVYYRYLLERGAQGATDDEVMRDTHIDHHAVGSIRQSLARLGALRSAGFDRTTRKGCLAEVWVAIPGVDVTRPVRKSERDELLREARRKVGMMTDAELRAFVGSTRTEIEDEPDPDDEGGGTDPDDFFSLFED